MAGYSNRSDFTWSDAAAAPTVWKEYRYKKWDSYVVHTQEITVLVTLVDIGYAKNAFIALYEVGGEVTVYEAVVAPWESMQMAVSPLQGLSLFESPDFFVFFFNNENGVKSVVARYKEEIDLNLVFGAPPAEAESITWLNPFNSDNSLFYVTTKHYNYKVNGIVRTPTKEYQLLEVNGMMDWGRGIWPYKSAWIWASGQGLYQSERIGLNIGEIYKTPGGSEATEDSFFLGSTLIKLCVISTEFGGMSPWHFSTVSSAATAACACANITFYPEKLHPKHLNYGVIMSKLDQAFGSFKGTIKTMSATYEISLRGLAEFHQARF